MFDNQMQTFKQTQAFAKASEQINQANTNLTKEMEKRQAIQGAAQTLAQDLLVAGAPVSRIQAAFQAFSPQAPPSSAEMIGVGIQTDNKDLVQTGIKQDKALGQASQDFKKELLSMQMSARNTQPDKSLRGMIDQRQREFNSVTKKMFESYQQADTAIQALDLKNPVADSAVKTMLAKASGEVGNLTEAEREMFGGSQAYVAKVKRLANMGAVGLLPEADRALLRQVASVYRQSVERQIAKKSELIANQLSQNSGIDKAEAVRLIAPVELFTAKESPQKQQGSGGGGLNLRNFKMGN